jgi:hypothetical protein
MRGALEAFLRTVDYNRIVDVDANVVDGDSAIVGILH